MNPWGWQNQGRVYVGLIILAFLFLVALLGASVSRASDLVYTLPTLTQPYWYEYDEEAGAVIRKTACNAVAGVGQQDTLHELQTAYLWWYPLSGHGFAVADSHSVVGREGQQDTFPDPGPGTGYVTTRNTGGMSCPSNVVTRLPDNLTGVDVVPIDKPVSEKIYSVLYGRPVSSFDCAASGVYVIRTTYASGRTSDRKVVYIRGGR